ncbi:hypothetical protein LIER_22260 [Lithospermum erythrorhizon]|uniref:TF-B3 domain-containing protein n=1 Tax=Lithospermum erythrorhizon TaxID=34254 RepID=A0AAV3QW78_LITER
MSSSSNLDLSLSLGGSSYTSVARDQIQETLDGDKQLAIVNTDQIPEKITPKSDSENKPYFFFDGIVKKVDEPVLKEQVHEVLLIEGPPPLPMARVVKVLKASDVNNCSRLMISKQFVQENVMPFLNDADRELVNGNGGINVSVYDGDTQSEHYVQFKLWPSSACYVFTGWSRQFTTRRSLREGDTISLSWLQNRFYFSVLQRAQ